MTCSCAQNYYNFAKPCRFSQTDGPWAMRLVLPSVGLCWLTYIYIYIVFLCNFMVVFWFFFLAHTKEWSLHLGGFDFWGFAKVFSLGATGRLVVFVGILVVFVWFWLWLGSAVGSLCRQCPLFLFCLCFATGCFLFALKVVSARLVAATITTTTATATTPMTKTTTATSLYKSL